MYRGCAMLNVVTYDAYQKNLLANEHQLRIQIFKSFIVTASLKSDNYDLLGSVAGSVLNDHESQLGSSVYTDSIYEQSRESEKLSRDEFNSFYKKTIHEDPQVLS